MAQSTRKFDAGRVPGPIEVPGAIEIVILWLMDNGKTARSYLHGRNLGSFTPSVTSATALFTALGNSWSSRLALYAPTTTNLTAVTVRDMTVHTNPIYQSAGTAYAGTSASPGMPPGVALVLTENVVQRGRGAKGRIYMPIWATNADATNGAAIPAVQAAMNNFGSDTYSELQGQSLFPTVAKAHRQAYTGFTGTPHNDRPAETVDITSYVCRDVIWDTQRRRGYIV